MLKLHDKINMYIKRNLESSLKKYIKFFPVVAITGPRQSGKSTLLRHCVPSYRYITFDDIDIREMFYADPKKFINMYQENVIFDEVQKVPEIFEYIKIIIDNDRAKKGRYILTGSSQFALVKKISESLAGRIGLLSLLPLDYQELSKESYDKVLYKGSYPEQVVSKFDFWKEWYSSYIDTYLIKDVREIANIGDIRDFQRLLQLLAANCAQQLNYTTFSNQLGVDVRTLKKWISILEASYIIFILPPYFDNFGKRIVKSPKIYFYDMGILCFLNKINNYDQYIQSPLTPAIFENFVISEIIKKSLHHKKEENFYYLRTNHGREVDLIIEGDSKIKLIEIKSSQTFKVKMLDHLGFFKKENMKKNLDFESLLLYQGDTMPDYDNCKILNYSDFLKN